MASDRNNEMIENIAHARKLASGEWDEPHALDDHLLEVANLAQQYAEKLGAEWAECAGLWHDLGKYRPPFQSYIRKKSGFDEDAHIEDAPNRVTHSTAGAIYARKKLGVYGTVLAYIIAGHHAGLPDWESNESGKGGLKYRLADSDVEYDEVMAKIAQIPDTVLRHDLTQLPKPPIEFALDTIALWVRMLFSCLVDADFLDTENYMNPEKASERNQYPRLDILRKKFQQHMEVLQSGAKKTKLNGIRSDVYQWCVQAGALPPGNFSLTVPTGGGKTLSSLAFAFEHAKQNKSRIIYAIPFTSIIEQNADVFRKALGNDAIVEHHSNLDTDPKKENLRRRLAAENWDAPIIVTTNVQLFESLFAARTSRCRKLHNLVNSVIILDEAQQIPREFQGPITKVMQELADHYGVTWLLCTATQPELGESRDTFGRVLLEGLNKPHEIIPDPEELARKLKRVEVSMPEHHAPRLSWVTIAAQLKEEPAVLAIVNTRRHARELFQEMPKDESTWHLSAQMCPNHRRQVIKDMHQRLKDQRDGKTDLPLRVISTQLIEAGVDVDFPVVYRALAGLDSIAQSAGRCNREGDMETLGRVVVFRPEENAPSGLLRQGQQVTEEMLQSGLSDALSPKNFSQYFSQLNYLGDRDKHGIVQLLTAQSNEDEPLAINFRSAAEKFRLINDAGVGLIVPYIPPNTKEGPDGEKKSPVHALLAKLAQDQSQKWIYRELQGYTVNLPEKQIEMMVLEGAVSPIAGQYVLTVDFRYDEHLGVLPPNNLMKAEDSVL